MQNSWFDSSALTNLFGYAIFFTLICSVLFFGVTTKEDPADKTFFVMCTLLFVFVLSLILFIGYLPNNTILAEKIFSRLSLPMQSFETPAKLRVLLLLSGLGYFIICVPKTRSIQQNQKKKNYRRQACFAYLPYP